MNRIYAFDHPHEPGSDLRPLLGGKGAGLADMTTVLGLPVPAGFTITTETCTEYLATGWPETLDAEIDYHMARLERGLDRRFGDPTDPLLVSVRSGASVSMPGMMDTILNVGLHEAAMDGLADVTGDRMFALDCRRRLEEMFRSTVGRGELPDDPRLQLRVAIEAVFRSWDSDRARTYRTKEQINHDLGTAVNVQAMVFGNRGPGSATGVMFTRNPATGTQEGFGDVLFDAQGEDVVAGTHQPAPLSELDETLPAVGAELREAAGHLERHHRDMCDIEFTVEEGTLWFLQVRVGKRSPRAALRIAVEMAEDPDFPLSRTEALERVADHLVDPPTESVAAAEGTTALTVGLPASPGMVAGEVVTTPEAAVTSADAGRTVILVRSDTSPADVHGMAAAAGILTATGGLASHAAVVARGWGIPAVVGAAELTVGADLITIAGTSLASGDLITINGSTGEVFVGDVSRESPDIVPEAEVLRDWAIQMDIDWSRRTVDESEPPRAARIRAISDDELVGLISIKGLVTPDNLASVAMADFDLVDAACQELMSRGLLEEAGPVIRLTRSGNARAEELLVVDRASWGEKEPLAVLDQFAVIDGRMKLIVTSWQVKDVDGEQLPNDHTDTAYDEAVLADLAKLHHDASEWLSRQAEAMSRVSTYLDRLDRAHSAVVDGDLRFVASPMVDSYHTVWFELHELLIRLAGRTRAEETEAGRA